MGDLAYNSGTESELEASMFKPYAAALRNLPLYTVVGNHDAISSSAQKRTGPYYNAFGMPSGGQSGGVASGSAAFYRYTWYGPMGEFIEFHHCHGRVHATPSGRRYLPNTA